MTDLGDPIKVRERTRDIARQRREREQMLHAIMDLKQGRQWVAELLAKTHVNAPSFSTEALAMAFAEGERNIGLWILADITSACPDQYIALLREQGESNEQRTLTDTNADASGESDSGSGTGPDAESVGGERPGESGS